MVRISKRFLYWLVLILIGCIAFLVLTANIPVTHSIPMTSTQAEIVREAVTLIITDIQAGKFTTTEDALNAFSVEIPTAVRDSVLRTIGQPALVSLPAVLEHVNECIVIVE